MPLDDAKDYAWQYLRRSRNSPPGYAKRGERKAVYTGALEQAEQFFRASDTIGQEIRPILLYYGLNQALRAVAAVGVPNPKTWTFSNHGLSCRNLAQIKKLEDVTVGESGDGGFQMLNRLYEAPDLIGTVTLGDLWASLPEGADNPLQNSDDRWTAVKLTTMRGIYNPELSVTTVYADTEWSGYLTSLPASMVGKSYDEVQQLVYQKYPALAIAEIALRTYGESVVEEPPPFGEPLNRPDVNLLKRAGKLDARSALRLLSMGSADSYDETDTSLFPGNLLIRMIPCLPQSTKPLHSLATWWAVLYGLSVVARYAPAKWTAMLDINSSPDAASIERVLAAAHGRCMQLICSQIVYLGSG